MNLLLPYGGFGLMLLAVCDSSFLSLPEVNDVLLMTFSLNNPAGMLKFAAFTFSSASSSKSWGAGTALSSSAADGGAASGWSATGSDFLKSERQPTNEHAVTYEDAVNILGKCHFLFFFVEDLDC